MTNGEPILVRGVMKPIPTLYKPLMSVDIETMSLIRQRLSAATNSSTSCRVVMEAVVATVLATEVEKFSSDNMEELKEAVAKHRDLRRILRERVFLWRRKLFILQAWA